MLLKKLTYGDKIWIKDQTGVEYPWIVEKENDNTYEIYHQFAMTHIPKDRFYHEQEEVEYSDLSDFNDRDSEGARHVVTKYKMVNKLKYNGWLRMIDRPGKEILDIV